RCNGPSLNGLLALSPAHWSALRRRLHELLRVNHPDMRHHRERVSAALVPQAEARMHLPFAVGDYTGFDGSLHHAANVHTMLRPDQPLRPNYRYLPVAAHGRASSIVVSGHPIVRPSGQALVSDRGIPEFGPT